MTETLQEDPIIKRQQVFVDWLKEKGLYNEFDSADNMIHMQKVWEACQEPVKIFTLFWRHDKTDIVEGKTIADAMNNFGFGAGALGALDFWKEGIAREDYVWNQNNRSWDPSKKENHFEKTI